VKIERRMQLEGPVGREREVQGKKFFGGGEVKAEKLPPAKE
jgi:hypothetical protein